MLAMCDNKRSRDAGRKGGNVAEKKLYIIKRNYENEFGCSTAAEQSFER